MKCSVLQSASFLHLHIVILYHNQTPPEVEVYLAMQGEILQDKNSGVTIH